LDPDCRFYLKSNPLSVQDVNVQLRALDLLSKMKGVSVKDLAEAASDISGLDITVSDDYEDALVGENGVEGGTPVGAGAEPPSGPAQTNGAAGGGPPQPPQADGPQTAAQSVSNADRRAAGTLASKVVRAIREYEDTQDPEALVQLLDLEKRYDELSFDMQELVNACMSPVVFSSPFLSDAAMQDVALGYAKAAFAEARRHARLSVEVV